MLGKIIAFITSAVLLISLRLFGCGLYFEGADNYIFYINRKGSDAAAVYCQDDFILTKLRLGKVYGESAVFKGNDWHKLLEKYKAEIVFEEKGGDKLCVYAYSENIQNCVDVGGKRINLQIAVGNGEFIAGTPIIFGGY